MPQQQQHKLTVRRKCKPAAGQRRRGMTFSSTLEHAREAQATPRHITGSHESAKKVVELLRDTAGANAWVRCINHLIHYDLSLP